MKNSIFILEVNNCENLKLKAFYCYGFFVIKINLKEKLR